MSTLKEEAVNLHAEGSNTYAAIARQLGVPYATVYAWCNPEYAERQRKSSRDAKRRRKPELAAYDKAYGKSHRNRCRRCRRMVVGRNAKGDVCMSCIVARKEARWRLIQEMWGDGLSRREIAEALDVSMGCLSWEIGDIRRAGWELPHRYCVRERMTV